MSSYESDNHVYDILYHWLSIAGDDVVYRLGYFCTSKVESAVRHCDRNARVFVAPLEVKRLLYTQTPPSTSPTPSTPPHICTHTHTPSRRSAPDTMAYCSLCLQLCMQRLCIDPHCMRRKSRDVYWRKNDSLLINLSPFLSRDAIRIARYCHGKSSVRL